MLKNILFPTDFSEASSLALAYAKQLAITNEATLHILHVVDDPFVNAATTSQQFRDELHKVAEKQFAALVADDEELSSATFVRREGPAFVEIVKYAKEEAIDVIVMATHGRSAIAHVLLGSVAENVLRFAPCPVLAVPDPDLKFELP